MNRAPRLLVERLLVVALCLFWALWLFLLLWGLCAPFPDDECMVRSYVDHFLTWIALI